MAKATASHTEAAFTDLCTGSPNPKAENDDSHASTQQPFRFMDLPPELRDIIYTFALEHETRKTQCGENFKEPDLLAGLSSSATAQALSQVCRIVRRESMKTYYSKTTFVVPDVPDPLARIMHFIKGGSPKAPTDQALDLWARTWGEFGAQHIRSLDIRPLGGVVRISMTDDANPVSLEEGTILNLSAFVLNAAGLRAFDTSVNGATAARKIEKFLCEVGEELRTALKRKVFGFLFATREI